MKLQPFEWSIVTYWSLTIIGMCCEILKAIICTVFRGDEILPSWLYHRGQWQRRMAWQSTYSLGLVFYPFAIGTSENRIFSCVVTEIFSFFTGYFMLSWAFSLTPILECQTKDVFLSLNKTVWDLFGLRAGVTAGRHFGQGEKWHFLNWNDRLGSLQIFVHSSFLGGENREILTSCHN